MRLASFILLALAACATKGATGPENVAATGSSPASSASGVGDPGTAPAEAAVAPSSGSAQPPAASSPPEPMGPDLPVDLGKKVPPFAVRAVSPDKGATVVHGAVPVPDAVASKVDPSAPFFEWEQVLPPRVVMTFPRQAGLDLYVVLFDGEVSIKADDIAGKQKRLWRWNAARVPGLGAMVESKEPTRAIFVLVANAPGATLGQAVAGAKVAWSKRPAPVTSVELDKQPDLAWGGGAYHARLGFEDGSASLGTLMASKTAPVPPNVHDHEWEILAVLAGEGTLVRSREGRDDNLAIAPGTFASIPPGVPHAYRPAGTSSLVAVQLYLPPGPEQRFKKLASVTAHP